MSVDDAARHGELLDPPLPYRMTPRVREAVGDVRLQQFVDNATIVKDQGRVDALGQAFGDDADAVFQGAFLMHD